MTNKKKYGLFPTAQQDASAAELCVSSPQTESSAYKLAYLDADFMMSDELRPVRLQLELLKPEMVQQAAGIESTVVVFGSARIMAPEVAKQALEKAIRSAEKNPADEGLQQAVRLARRAEKNSKYYTEACRFS